MSTKILLSLIGAFMLVGTQAGATDYNDPNFRYYRVTCIDKITHTNVWFDISREWDYTWTSRCNAVNGYLDVYKAYWREER
ncbi:hypothetical protein [Pseudoalteromonas luteoviolacea]|uniref:Uncharacterized protein n=1 Tax=Pseudoalteromonas luteoviolacea S4054 TaxID=1129367 RepID=A0A0F6A4Q1_9GAMM|nr:hypothetical protein [Pseudoalteromonas luteoviolacea]AOT07674.1 hypothetical protein S4054249_07370 [Pseudoalteromonas luteoviolacea]AOT12590.1 hypothetical protein S40542_07370 [Pseudoalteromonas luteoviolacea]AOT17504.1 hypothetical protein S4054_07370 [Pseudoalteromonas luteoviolacea]KKE81210.1 hypothetical protein N479_23295 [Pseudoalteromonas luteoviolacea S4054]KZN66338.1 hypothetical protein N481_24390 [Pseudoalteromonas luteoviolacea S4047-1]